VLPDEALRPSGYVDLQVDAMQDALSP